MVGFPAAYSRRVQFGRGKKQSVRESGFEQNACKRVRVEEGEKLARVPEQLFLKRSNQIPTASERRRNPQKKNEPASSTWIT